jgi:SAM-dependent methyltransferase
MMRADGGMDACRKSDWYSDAPEYGLHGKWPPEIRMSGLKHLSGACAGKSVLDLGAAEGLIARRFLQQGAALVHGFDIVPGRVAAARRICGDFPNGAFWQADLSDWGSFRAACAGHLLARYDIVLYLGLHHHLSPTARGSTLAGAAAMSGDAFALRTPDACYGDDGVAGKLHGQGFQLAEEDRTDAGRALGPLRIFRRSEASTDPRR